MRKHGRDVGFAFVFKRDGGRCRYCGAPGQALDHVKPKVLGGSNDPFTNKVLACHPCNSTKSREDGFELRAGVLYYDDRIVAEGELWGEELWQIVRWRRLNRQAESGLMWAQERLG